MERSVRLCDDRSLPSRRFFPPFFVQGWQQRISLQRSHHVANHFLCLPLGRSVTTLFGRDQCCPIRYFEAQCHSRLVPIFILWSPGTHTLCELAVDRVSLLVTL